MRSSERRLALVVSATHGSAHFFKRLLPPLIPIWSVAFGLPLWQLGLLLTANKLGSGLGHAPMGELSDRYDRRYLLPAGVALAGVSFALVGLLPTIPWIDASVSVAGYPVTLSFVLMAAFLFVAGLGTSVVHPTGYPLLSVNIREERQGRALGIWGSTAKFGDALAPIVIGVSLFVLGWHQILGLLGLLGVAYAAVVFRLLDDFVTDPGAESADEEGTESDEDAGEAAWRTDRRVYVYPMLAIFAFFALRMVAASGVTSFIPQFITSVYSFSITVFGHEVTPASTASFYYSALLVTAGVVQLGTGELVDRYDARKVLVGFLLVAALSIGVLAQVTLSPMLLLGALVVIGASMWGLSPARDQLVTSVAPESREGRTFGYLWTGAMLVGAGAPVVVGYMGESLGLREAFLVLAAVTLLSAVPIAILLSRRVYVRDSDGAALPSD